MDEKKHYRIRGVGPGFDGLIVESSATHGLSLVRRTLRQIDRLTNSSVVFGDRNVSIALPPGALYIEADFLQEVDDPGQREFDSTSSYGKLELEGRFAKDELEVVYSRFERTLCVSVRERDERGRFSTKWAQNFNDPEKFRDILGYLESLVKDGQDLEDVVFNLEEMLRGKHG